MKRVIPFNRAFLPCVILSVAIIAGGLFGYFTKGINYGIDFQFQQFPAWFRWPCSESDLAKALAARHPVSKSKGPT